MNQGIIASRYATALLKLVEETGSGEAVVKQAESFAKALATKSKPGRVADALLSLPDLEPDLRKLTELMVKNGRADCIKLAFNSFVSLYYKSKGIVRGRLVLPSPADSSQAFMDLETKLKELISSRTGQKLQLTTEVDESIIGGFVLEVEDHLLDASVSHQLELIKRQFIERNRRIV